MGLFRRSSPTEEQGRWIVVGLGNPGERYASTRHNLGAMVVEELLSRAGGRFKSHKSGCLVCEAIVSGAPVVIARPTSYMNESGRPVGALVRWYKGSAQTTIVVHDELDLAFGEVRIKSGGGTAGHNGVSSVADHIGRDFIRVRVGIGRPRGRTDAMGHVLDTFSSSERKELPFVIALAADAVEKILADGPERAMNEVNTRD
jgi:PTH1 family peptidyl-tRNA hydrolase